MFKWRAVQEPLLHGERSSPPALVFSWDCITHHCQQLRCSCGPLMAGLVSILVQPGLTACALPPGTAVNFLQMAISGHINLAIIVNYGQAIDQSDCRITTSYNLIMIMLHYLQMFDHLSWDHNMTLVPAQHHEHRGDTGIEAWFMI